MFFVFGYEKRRKDLGPAGERTCANCGNRRSWRRYRETGWITFFFIPVLPTGRKDLSLCPVCSHRDEESDE